MASRLAEVLMAYHTTPQSTTGVSPELLGGRQIHTQLDLLKPKVSYSRSYLMTVQPVEVSFQRRNRIFV